MPTCSICKFKTSKADTLPHFDTFHPGQEVKVVEDEMMLSTTLRETLEASLYDYRDPLAYPPAAAVKYPTPPHKLPETDYDRLVIADDQLTALFDRVKYSGMAPSMMADTTEAIKNLLEIRETLKMVMDSQEE